MSAGEGPPAPEGGDPGRPVGPGPSGAAPQGPPRPRRRGCLVGILLTALLVVVLTTVFYAKRVDLGLWLIRRGIPQQPWGEETRRRALDLLGRTEEAYRAGKIDRADEEALQPLVDALEEASADGEVSEAEAGPLLEEWEVWLDGL